MRERVSQRTFSGYRLNLPEGMKLFVVLRDGTKIELDYDYWTKRAGTIFQDVEEGWIK